MKELQTHKCHGGTLKICSHQSAALGCEMTFSIFLPPQAQSKPVPALTFLSGLTCTHENFTTKSNAYGYAAQHGIAIIAPDTSPRGDSIPDDDAYDLGQGAGFYINATNPPWNENFQMERYITQELYQLVHEQFPLSDGHGITGHSMGGHGALTLFLKHPDLYQSVSAFSPIVAPSSVPWGKKAFQAYIGDDRAEWKRHDACKLVKQSNNTQKQIEILIDQGGGDNFLKEQLKPELFEDACNEVGQKLNLRIHDEYDHSYYFIQSFIGDHLHHHANYLNKESNALN